MKRVAVLLALLASPAAAQVSPEPGPGDPRLQLVEYHRNQVVLIQATPGYQVTIELAPDEQVQNVALGDSGAWQVTANHSGNLLFVKPTQAGADTNMTVITNARFYAFDLRTAGGGSAPYEVRFRYPKLEAGDGGAARPTRIVGRYHASGAEALQPSQISDDGEKTYIVWPEDVALPAVFILDRHKRELLANGNMRGGIYVIDSVNPHLLFRIDRQTARADRDSPEADRK